MSSLRQPSPPIDHGGCFPPEDELKVTKKKAAAPKEQSPAVKKVILANRVIEKLNSFVQGEGYTNLGSVANLNTWFGH
jgi:hypothetical protein